MSTVGRMATWTAVVVLALNAVLLGVAGVGAGRPLLLVAAAAAIVVAGTVLWAWRRHLAALDAMAQERRALREEALALRDLVRRKPQ